MEVNIPIVVQMIRSHLHHFTVARRKGVWEIVQTANAPPATHSLTPREREVLTWAARGKSAWEIGEILHISKRTVDERVQTAVRKLGAANRTQAVAIAVLKHIIGELGGSAIAPRVR